MIELFKDVRIDWMGNRRLFIGVSVVLMLAGLASAVIRTATGRQPFNLGVDFKGGTVITAKFKQRPSDDAIRDALVKQGARDAIVQAITSAPDTVLIKLPLEAQAGVEATDQVIAGRNLVRQALATFGQEADPKLHLSGDANSAFEIVGTDAVGEVAGAELRNKAIAVTLLALVGMLIYIGARFEWTYGIAAVVAVFHDVLITLGFFTIFQWEVNLTVIAALLTLVGFSVNDTIVIFDRVRENLKLHRRDSLYNITNDAINQTLSRTVITSGLVFLSVLALVVFGGEVLRGFSLALMIGIIFGTYSTVAIASPIMVWWQQRVEAADREDALKVGRSANLHSAAKSVVRDTQNARASKRSTGASRV
jgi:preprotein translocase subunit SecF